MGSQIKNLRHRAGLTQKDLAKRLKVSKACVCRYEKNITTPNGEILIKIARILKVEVSKLTNNNREERCDLKESKHI